MKEKSRRHLDYVLMIVTLVIVVYGLIMVFSASYYKAQASALYDYDGFYLFKRQAAGAVIGCAAMLLLAFIDYRSLIRFKYVILIISLILLVVVFIPGIGVNLNGSSRWIKLGPLPAFQPAEIAKLAMVIFTAATIYVNRNRMDSFRYGILPNLLVLLLMCLLLFFQPNFSSVILLCLLVFIMMYVGGAKGAQLGLLAAVGGTLGFALLMVANYRARRVTAFADPWQYAQNGGWQVIQSLYGIGAGGLTGRGLGNSRQKYLWLPYGESDFIFSITAEEVGLVGSVLLIGLFVLLIYRGVRIAASAPDLFGTLLATGISSLIGIQAIMNIAVATASMPVTGVPMPFFSYGSSSLVIFMAMVGIMLNISRQAQRIRIAVPSKHTPPVPSS
ncbi:MAG: putative lipid II flippase FtsW [Clostridia bacterium]|nr:putative lipid II flippase FtsW [Clostridia bacterium]